MTTIAWDGQILAVDSNVYCNGAIVSSVQKLFVGENLICAGAGDLEQVRQAIGWMMESDPGTPKPALDPGEVELLVFDWSAKQMFMYEERLVGWKVDGPVTMGSGAKWALAAMDHGKNAIDAVKYASTRCCYTGGPVQTWTVGARSVVEYSQ